MLKLENIEMEYKGKGISTHALNGRRVEKFRKENISFVFQQFALLDDYTVYENVELPLRVKNLPKRERKRQVPEVLAKFGIAELEKKYITQISGGQQQRCSIARAVVAGTDIILADEPTGALDEATGQEIMEILKELNWEGMTVIIVTHNMEIAAQTDRIKEIKDEKIVNTVPKTVVTEKVISESLHEE